MSRAADPGRGRHLARGVPFGPDTIVIAEVFSKKTQATPKHVTETCQGRLKAYDAVPDDEED